MSFPAISIISESQSVDSGATVFDSDDEDWRQVRISIAPDSSGEIPTGIFPHEAKIIARVETI